MANKSSNSNLNKAAKVKNDEFYTLLSDIEKELRHYKEQFREQTIYCNCDDPFESNFFKYFASNFNALGLKKIITTSYIKSPIVGGQLPLFEVEGLKPTGVEPFKIEITEVPDANGDGAINIDDVKYLLQHDRNIATPLKGNGDFRSEECVELLKEVDVVVTNPPFSLFREYIAQLIEHDKKFLIIGSDNARTYMDVFKYIQYNELWSGYGRAKQFIQPDNTIKKFGNIGWYTNLDVKKRHDFLTLYKKYTPKEYPKYYNYDAIEVSKVVEIPIDYDGLMGVPISFLDKYNPDQFEIHGSSKTLAKPMSKLAEKGSYSPGGPRFYLSNDDGTFRRLYDRIVIKHKQ
jgi:hypothetical protein